MPLEELKKKSLRIPLEEFQSQYNIPGTITDIHYYQGMCSKDEEDKKRYVDIHVEIE